MNKAQKHLIVIFGPTAVGKTSVAIELAKQLKTEICSADSRQLYHELTIGTAKPTVEELNEVKHHFINSISIHDLYSAGQYEQECLLQLDSLFKNKNVVVLAGGTGLYIDAVLTGLDQFPTISDATKKEVQLLYEQNGLNGLQTILKEKDPVYYKVVDLENSRRLTRALEVITESNQPYSDFLNQPKPKRPFEPIFIYLQRDRPKLYERINSRVDLMIKNGLLDEVEELQKYRHLKSLQTVGYSELFKYFEDEITLEFAISEIKKNSRRYAKRQTTWFRKYNCDPFYPEDLNLIRKHIDDKMATI